MHESLDPKRLEEAGRRGHVIAAATRRPDITLLLLQMEKVYLATAIPVPLVGREDCLLRSSETLSLDVAKGRGVCFTIAKKKKERKERNTLLVS